MIIKCSKCGEDLDIEKDWLKIHIETIVIKKSIQYIYKKLIETIGKTLADSIFKRDKYFYSYLEKRDRDIKNEGRSW